ncbi:MAG: Do family serine endopeptidase [Pelagibacteraceae bacterium]|nr:Do family serine endopeptidase [Pelagibacteraceae bacterium]
MQNFKKILLSFFLLNLIFTNSLTAKPVPASFADLAEKLMPSVVNISTTQTIKTSANPFPFQFPPGSPFEEMFKDYNQPRERQASSLGSGFIINKNGTIITNNHVINNADDIVVIVGDKEYKAEIIGADPYADIAVLKINSKDIFKPVKFGNSDKARVGDWVIAIGNPFGLGGTVTSGIISARNRDINLTRYDDFIQTDASINQGNSGGPLFDLNGDVIGVNTAIIGQGGSVGIGFAIPSNAASDVIDQLIKYGETRRGWLGVRIQEVTKEIADVEGLKNTQGALIASVGEKSPADKAGLKAGDIILKFDGKKIDTMRTLPKLVSRTEVGKSVELEIWRNKKILTKKLKLGRLESSADFKAETKTSKPKAKTKDTEIESLKISVREITSDDIETRKLNKNLKGVVITYISNNSPVASYLQVGDIILEVQKNKISNTKQLKNLIEDIYKEGKQTILLAIINKNNQRRYLGVKTN